ncbi:MAG: hypothetical protein PHN60_04460 [Candidatus Gracilibacteria bacterium]|nr:hypothetical protein [Candidatus Gracilibacteria bacterium]
MNDFFTELDSDILGVRKTQETPKYTVSPLQKERTEMGGEKPVTGSQKNSPHNANRNIPHSPSKSKSEKIPNREQNVQVPTTYIADIRAQMMKSGVVTIVFKADEKTKTLLGHLKLETRGFVYLDEVREAHKMIIKRARASYEDTIKDVPDIEEKDLIKIIRHDLEIFLQQKMERNPVIIPIIISV